MNKIDYIEFWTNEPKQLGDFLHNVFGWKIYPPKDDGYTHWQNPSDESIGGIHVTDKPAGGTRTMAYVNITDVVGMVKKVKEFGGQIVYGPESVDVNLMIVNLVAPEGTPIGMWAHQ